MKRRGEREMRRQGKRAERGVGKDERRKEKDRDARVAAAETRAAVSKGDVAERKEELENR